ncbi:MAG: hypothetical protein QM779_09305 [Propionicimonas sp.]|uniref:hypothetical protein n=1 Tax=Propionicimonas sp. TaxID=1955623 RepID=UPI003D151F17
MRTNNALQVIFAFFLGLVVVAFVGIGVNTFYPEPEWTGTGEGYPNWRLTTGIILLVCATVLLVISLMLPEAQGVLSNGVLLGGVFTMVYAVGVTVTTDRSVLRFIVVAAALAVTIGIGWVKFARSHRVAGSRTEVGEPAAAVPSAPASEAASGALASAEASGAPASADLAGRLAAVERRLDALARALQP